MVCSADDLVEWKDFPKGLRVLLFDEDATSAAETKLKLQAVDYIVFSFFNEKDALEAVSRKDECFHVAIVEITATDPHGSFKFLEIAKDLPTIVISNTCCVSTMMKCIALGAAEFVQKPLSEDKLRNIWQHVVHKAFNPGKHVLSKSLEPIKETVASMFQIKSDTAELKLEIPSANGHEENDRFSAPSTPQLVKGGRLLDHGDCLDQPNCSTQKESAENDKDSIEEKKCSHAESKSVDNTSNSLFGDVNSSKKVLTSRPTESAAEEEVNSRNGSKNDEYSTIKEGSQPSSHVHNGDNVEPFVEDPKRTKTSISNHSYSHGSRGRRKKMKVDWTPGLHKQFVQAVEQLGVDQAIPSKILELMKVEGLTRHNIASHLQKYRMHRRHILPKDDDQRWQPHKEPMPRYQMQKPLVAFPPYHSNYGFPPNQIYPFWGHSSYHPPAVGTWGHAGFPTWHPYQGSWFWKSHHGIHADVWGCPVISPYSPIPSQNPTPSNGLDATGDGSNVSKDSYEFNLEEDVIDEVVKEAMSKPWLPLPLGLKAPSTDSVLAELHRQGIRTIPPRR